MVKIEENVIVNCPIEEVWKLITDVSKLNMWDATINEAKLTSVGALGIGTTVDLTAKMRNMKMSIRVTGFEPDRKFQFEHTSGPAKGSIITFSMETIDGKTKLAREADMKYSGVYKLLGPFLTPRMKKDTSESLGSVKHIIESRVQS